MIMVSGLETGESDTDRREMRLSALTQAVRLISE
jgi:hypothetical protein